MNYIKNILICFQLLMMSHSVIGFIDKDQLEVGDIILIPVKCYVCSAIEVNTNSRFSHLGIVINKQKEVAHALGKVKKEPLTNFLKMKDPSREAAVVRLVGLNFRTRQDMTKEFYKNYLGAFRMIQNFFGIITISTSRKNFTAVSLSPNF